MECMHQNKEKKSKGHICTLSLMPKDAVEKRQSRMEDYPNGTSEQNTAYVQCVRIEESLGHMSS